MGWIRDETSRKYEKTLNEYKILEGEPQVLQLGTQR
jgi:hypothetical protein